VNEPQTEPEQQPQVDPFPSGPFVEISPGVWVNALHVASVNGNGDDTACWVSMAGTGADNDVSYRVPARPHLVVGSLVQALVEYEQERGEAQERGRLEALSEDERTTS